MPSSRSEQQALSLLALPYDIQTLIVDHIRCTTNHTLRSIRLANKHFCHLASEALVRFFEVDYRKCDYDDRSMFNLFHKTQGPPPSVPTNVELERTEQLESSDLLHAVRTLNIIYASPGAVSRHAQRIGAVNQAICRLLPRMRGLHDVHIRLSFGRLAYDNDILRTLSTYCPGVRLHYHHGHTMLHQQNSLATGIIPELKGNHNLYALKLDIQYTNAQVCQSNFPILKRVLLSCPNLRNLHLSIGMPTSGCVIYPVPDAYCGLGFANGEKLPPLEVLDLARYPFERSARTHSLQDERNGEISYWVEVFDWSQLRSLHCGDPVVTRQLLPRLTSLEKIRLSAGWEYDNEILLACPLGLQGIQCRHNGSPSQSTVTPWAGIQRHAHSLTSLELHSPEGASSHKRPTLTAEQLLWLSSNAPNLTHLCIAVHREDTWVRHPLRFRA